MRKRVPLAASVLVHATAVVLVFTLSFPAQIPGPGLRARAITLLAPVPVPVRVRVKLAVPVEIPSPRVLREFHAPAGEAKPAAHREVVLAPAIEIPRPLLVALELPHLAVLPAPPLRVDNLALPVVVAPVAAATAVVRVAGFSGAVAGAQRATGTVRRAGFEGSTTGDAAAPPRLLAHAGFGDASVASGPGTVASVAVAPVTRPVEILSKPKPVYTEEARERRMEGEVLLQVLFAASGQVHVLATVRGLGYGLDENAVAAAEAIHFRPAERAGVAADSTAIVHIVFQLAY